MSKILDESIFDHSSDRDDNKAELASRSSVTSLLDSTSHPGVSDSGATHKRPPLVERANSLGVSKLTLMLVVYILEFSSLYKMGRGGLGNISSQM